MTRTVTGMLHEAAKAFGDRPYLCVKEDEGYVPKSYRETADSALAFAGSLLAYGFEPGSKVAILSEGSANCVVGEFGTLHDRERGMPRPHALRALLFFQPLRLCRPLQGKAAPPSPVENLPRKYFILHFRAPCITVNKDRSLMIQRVRHCTGDSCFLNLRLPA